MMKIDNLVEESLRNRKMNWNGNPDIGCHANGTSLTLYYGTSLSNVKNCLREGIVPVDDYVLFAAEPNTALSHAAMATQVGSSRINAPYNKRAVLEVSIPLDFLQGKSIISENDQHDRFTDKKLYESWGKSDAEYYALINILVPSHIPVEYIKGYMVREDDRI